LNVPLQTAPGRFYIDNAGAATSKGVEFELQYRPLAGWDFFGSVGFADAEFDAGSTENDVEIGGHRLPFAPRFTGNIGTQFAWKAGRTTTLYARAEVTIYGDFEYDASNLAGQETYSLANFRAGLRRAHWFFEGWINNAFDTTYVPLAFPYSTAFAPSGYVGENGAPVTFGVRAGGSF
jgi:iron complex outermembrane receptor protein